MRKLTDRDESIDARMTCAELAQVYREALATIARLREEHGQLQEAARRVGGPCCGEFFDIEKKWLTAVAERDSLVASLEAKDAELSELRARVEAARGGG